MNVRARGLLASPSLASWRQGTNLSNAGLWCLGRLQTDADRARVLDGLSATRGCEAAVLDELGTTPQRLRASLVRRAQCAFELAADLGAAVCAVAHARANDAGGDSAGAGGKGPGVRYW